MKALLSQRRFLNWGAGRLAVYEAGQGSALSILFCHGNSSSSNAFIRQFETLAARFHLITFDLPGHGDSDKAAREDYSLPGHSDALQAVANDCRSGPLLLVGVSPGGHVVLEALPEMTGVAAAVLVGAPPVASGTGRTRWQAVCECRNRWATG